MPLCSGSRKHVTVSYRWIELFRCMQTSCLCLLPFIDETTQQRHVPIVYTQCIIVKCMECVMSHVFVYWNVCVCVRRQGRPICQSNAVTIKTNRWAVNCASQTPQYQFLDKQQFRQSTKIAILRHYNSISVNKANVTQSLKIIYAHRV